jgi:hypothetical protein
VAFGLPSDIVALSRRLPTGSTGGAAEFSPSGRLRRAGCSVGKHRSSERDPAPLAGEPENGLSKGQSTI